MGNLSVGAWSTPIPSLISTVLRTAPYTLESSRQVLYSEWWRQSWSLKKRWTAAPCYPKVKGREDSKGLLSCRRGNPSWVAKEPFYSHTMSLLILRQEVTQPPLTLQSSLWDQAEATTPPEMSALPASYPSSILYPPPPPILLLGDFPLTIPCSQILGLKSILSNTPLKDVFLKKWKRLFCIPALTFACFTFFLLVLINFYWSTVTLQGGISCFCAAKWISHLYACTHISPLVWTFFPQGTTEFPGLYSRFSLVI